MDLPLLLSEYLPKWIKRPPLFSSVHPSQSLLFFFSIFIEQKYKMKNFIAGKKKKLMFWCLLPKGNSFPLAPRKGNRAVGSVAPIPVENPEQFKKKKMSFFIVSASETRRSSHFEQGLFCVERERWLPSEPLEGRGECVWGPTGRRAFQDRQSGPFGKKKKKKERTL